MPRLFPHLSVQDVNVSEVCLVAERASEGVCSRGGCDAATVRLLCLL
jgi:hypothetical protein